MTRPSRITAGRTLNRMWASMARDTTGAVGIQASRWRCARRFERFRRLEKRIRCALIDLVIRCGLRVQIPIRPDLTALACQRITAIPQRRPVRWRNVRGLRPAPHRPHHLTPHLSRIEHDETLPRAPCRYSLSTSGFQRSEQSPATQPPDGQSRCRWCRLWCRIDSSTVQKTDSSYQRQ